MPLSETIHIAVKLILENKKDLQLLFRLAMAQTHFNFDEKIFDQVDGVAMGSTLGPVLGLIFLWVIMNKNG